MKGIIFIIIGIIPFFCSNAFSAPPDLGMMSYNDGQIDFIVKLVTNNALEAQDACHDVEPNGSYCPKLNPVGGSTTMNDPMNWDGWVCYYTGWGGANYYYCYSSLYIPPDPNDCPDSEKLCICNKMECSSILVESTYVRFGQNCDQDQIQYVNEGIMGLCDSDPDSINSIIYPIDSSGPCFCPGSPISSLYMPISLVEFSQHLKPKVDSPAPPANDKYGCVQKCFPRDYIYSDGKCICFDETKNPNFAQQSPGPSTPSDPATPPSDPTNESQQLSTVNENLGSVVDQMNQNNSYLSNLSENLATSVNNQSVVSDQFNRSINHLDSNFSNFSSQVDTGFSNLEDSFNNDLTTLNTQLGNTVVMTGNNISGTVNNVGTTLSSKLDSINNNLSDIKNNQNQGFELSGTSGLPDDNVYDSDVDNVEENSFSDAIGSYLSSGIPILSYIKGTSLSLSGASSSMSVELWGSTVDFDLAPMANILDTMGYILSGISVIVAFGIIVGRG